MDMAARLGVSQPTVAKMLKRTASVGLIEQIPWRGIFLTSEGEKLARGEPRAPSNRGELPAGDRRQPGDCPT